MSSTPRTDRAEHQSELDSQLDNNEWERFAIDGWAFARKLERENQRLREERDCLEEEVEWREWARIRERAGYEVL